MNITSTLRFTVGAVLLAGTVALAGCGPEPVTQTTTTTERTTTMPPTPPVTSSTTTTEQMVHHPYP